jgi:hypothetical protein
MSDMKLIMEGWREYNSIDEQYDEALAYILESYDGLLTEGVKEDILSGMKSLVKKFGKPVVTAALVAAIATNALAPGVAMAADQMTTPDLPVAAQQMDVSDATATMKLPVGKAVKDIFGKGGKLDKFGKDTFGKDGKIKDLLKKKDKGADDTPDAEPEGELIASVTSLDGGMANDLARSEARSKGFDLRQLEADGLLGITGFIKADGKTEINLYKLDTPKPTPDLKAMVKKNLENN